VCNRRQPLNGTGFDLFQVLPEIFDRLDMAPQTSLLARGHVEVEQGRDVVGRGFRGGLAFGCRAGRRVVGRGSRCHRAALGRTLLQATRHRLAEQHFGLADQFCFHVAEDAVEIEGDA